MTSPSAAPTQDVCPLAAWGCRTGLRQPDWRLVSSHDTSDGSVEYCRCTCAALVILHEGELAAFAADHPAQ
ncbi:hypothetical protein [Streptomyces sp. GS7]|uniref:hypothetical protein n=1 Tax=Streptomyces sp. GS7 TaxID=2692234 RepID=UPI001316CF73|nr:hypothetical protein [Streptomyces sp. GS7]QHC24602.1 hypothetical protein GR130_27765 [Streptomyces sp. GS7]